MLSNLASYLGYQLAPAELEPDVAEAVRLCAVEEDDWLLVERQELPVEEAMGTTTTTASSSLPGARPCPSLQESWYLTPPPSFAPSRGPVHMETSPLENLLIEHPSMSVYQKSSSLLRRKTSNSSRSASEEESPRRPSSEDGTPTRLARMNKLPRSKYSKKTSTKRPPCSSSDETVSMPSASDEEAQESKELKVKNFVKSPRKSLTSAKGLSKKSFTRRPDTSTSSDEMISMSNEEDMPKLAPAPCAPPRKLYSDVLRMKPKTPAVEICVAEAAVNDVSTPAPVEIKEASMTAPSAGTTGSTSASPTVSEEEVLMIEETEGPIMEKDRRRPAVPDQQRQHFLNRSAQKLEQRKTCEMAKRSTMGRNNKAREMNSRNKRQRRSDMMQRHSGVNNNRKCC